MRSRLAFIVVCLLPACAAFYPVATSRTPETERIQLDIIEGRGNAVVLRIASHDPNIGLLEVYRVVDGAEPDLRQEVLLDETLKRELPRGIEYVDRGLETERSYTFVVRGRGDGVDDLSNEVHLTWQGPPPTPTVESATELGVVTLRWKSSDFAVVIFRRNVLLTNAPVERVAEIPAHTTTFWSDTAVEPGDVFTYQLAFAHRIDGTWNLYGLPTEPIYVTVTGSDERPKTDR